MKKGQAMIEAVIAVSFVAFILLVFFHLSRMLSARVLVEHAAARAARARCVGFDDFMCLKVARVAMIPASGQRLTPAYVSGRDFASDLSIEEGRVPVYLCARSGVAGGVLNYERWSDTDVKVRTHLGVKPVASARIKMRGLSFFDAPDDGHPVGREGRASVEGEAEIEAHYPFYME